MVANDRSQELLNALEDVLVKEFRLSQNLHALTKEERNALVTRDTSQLLSLVERKEALLDELGQLDDSRRMITQETCVALDLKVESSSVADIVAAVDAEYATRLGHLREGILALMNEIRDITHGNQTLATTALERSDAVQAFLLSLLQPPSGYRPYHGAMNQEPTVVWGVEKAA